MEEFTVKIKMPSDQNIDIQVKKTDSILDLKGKIKEATKINTEEQKLIFKGRILKEADVLEKLNVAPGNVIHLVVLTPHIQNNRKTDPFKAKTS